MLAHSLSGAAAAPAGTGDGPAREWPSHPAPPQPASQTSVVTVDRMARAARQ